MSRKTVLWKKKIRQSGDVNKIIPTGATGAGTWLTKTDISSREMKMPKPGEYEGKTVTAPMKTEKEQIVRRLVKS